MLQAQMVLEQVISLVTTHWQQDVSEVFRLRGIDNPAKESISTATETHCRCCPFPGLTSGD